MTDYVMPDYVTGYYIIVKTEKVSPLIPSNYSMSSVLVNRHKILKHFKSSKILAKISKKMFFENSRNKSSKFGVTIITIKRLISSFQSDSKTG